MKFLLTMNMPSVNGKAVHQIVAEHNSKDVGEFAEYVADHNVIVVEEFYKDDDTGQIRSQGSIALNCSLIGKIKAYKPSSR